MAKQSNIVMLANSIEKAKNEKLDILNHAGKNGGYIVVNEERNAYFVTIIDEIITACTCPHHTNRRTICKHMIKVALEKGHDVTLVGINYEDKED